MTSYMEGEKTRGSEGTIALRSAAQGGYLVESRFLMSSTRAKTPGATPVPLRGARELPPTDGTHATRMVAPDDALAGGVSRSASDPDRTAPAGLLAPVSPPLPYGCVQLDDPPGLVPREFSITRGSSPRELHHHHAACRFEFSSHNRIPRRPPAGPLLTDKAPIPIAVAARATHPDV